MASSTQPTATVGIAAGNGMAVLAITLSVQAAGAMAVMAVPVMAPVVAGAASISAAYVGLYIAIAYSGALAASLFSGAAVRRHGGIRVGQACGVICAGGLAVCTIPAWPAIAAGAWLVGFGYGPITAASSHLLARSTPAHRMSLVFSVKQTGVPLGGALAGALVPGMQLWTGWQAALLAVAAANLLFAAAAQPMRARFDQDRDASRRLASGNLLQPVLLALTEPTLRILALCSFVFSIVQLSLTTYLVTHLTESLSYGLLAAGFMLSVSQIAAVFARVFWGYAADRWLGARRMLAVLAALMATCTLATALLHEQTPAFVVLAVLLVFGASAIGWNGVYLAEVARQAPAGMAAVATGGTLAITFFGVVIGPPLFGAVSSLFGTYRAGFALLSLPLLACVGGLLWCGRSPDPTTRAR